MKSISSIVPVKKDGESMKIRVFGLGYIELSIASLFVQSYEIIGVDKNNRIIDILNTRRPPFNEPGLDELMNRVKGYFQAQTNVDDVDVFLINFSPPLDKSMKIAHLKYVRFTDAFLKEVVSIKKFFKVLI